MEEQVGALWHRWITRLAQRSTPEAVVTLAEMEKTAGLLFRAFGGDPGLRVVPASAQQQGARRGWLARIAGVGDTVECACRDQETLQLPGQLAVLPSRALNRDLYLWLIALAAAHGVVKADAPWWAQNQQATQITLARYPGLWSRYRRLVEAVLKARIPPERLPPDEAAQETALYRALQEPGSITQWPAARRPLPPVPLWLYPSPVPAATQPKRKDAAAEARRPGNGQPVERDRQRRRAEYTDLPERQSPFLLPFRAESLLSWAEFVRVNRPNDDDAAPDAGRAANDMPVLSITQDNFSTAARVRFDLDLPSASEDDLPLGPGMPFPEWDYRKQALLPDYCAVQEMLARRATPCPLPQALRRTAQRLRHQFEVLRPARGWRSAQPEGEELDLDACVRHAADSASGESGYERGLYRQLARRERDLACLLLADLSLSTDAWVNNHGRVIEMIRDSLFLFACCCC